MTTAARPLASPTVSPSKHVRPTTAPPSSRRGDPIILIDDALNRPWRASMAAKGRRDRTALRETTREIATAAAVVMGLLVLWFVAIG